ncbi:hypothetical protein ACHAWF_017190 [Thalassiosira exigua]
MNFSCFRIALAALLFRGIAAAEGDGQGANAKKGLRGLAGNQFDLDARDLLSLVQNSEYHRDENLVYLADRNGRDGTLARLDLYLAQILYCPRGGECFSIGNIKEVTGKQPNPVTPNPTCSRDKRVSIYKFWINGQYETGTHNEHQLRLDGSKYFPNHSSDCDQYTMDTATGGKDRHISLATRRLRSSSTHTKASR